MHNAATTSDPKGELALAAREPALLASYRFGLGTADFWLCRACGVYLGATTIDRRFGIINTNALIDRLAPQPPQPVSYDGETSSGRVARRQQRWTPLRTSSSKQEPG